MERITNEMLKIIQQCREELKELENYIKLHQDDKLLNQQQYIEYKGLIQKCHNVIKERINLLTTILETDSIEILEMVKQKV